MHVDQAPALLLLCLMALVLLVFQHGLFAVSPETSFAHVWIVACLPLWVLVAAPVGRLLFRLLFIVVLLYATYSVFDFLVFGQRAHSPLLDPNNYVTLLYLAWIPWLLGSLNTRSRVGVLVITLLFCTAMFATSSRYAMLVVTGACALSFWLCHKYRFGYGTPLAASAGAVLALALAFTFEQSSLTSAFGEETDQPSVRLVLIQAALELIRNEGLLAGTGIGSFSIFYPMIRPVADQETNGQFVHNDYLQLAFEGGVWLLVPLIVLVVAVAWCCIRGTFVRREWDSRLPFAVAAAVALLHAAVNFVFYILPLVVVLGVLVAIVFAPEAQPVSPRGKTGSPSRGLWAVVGFGLILNLGWLGLDVYNQAAFAGRPALPGVSGIRRSSDSLLEYVETTLALNSDRGLPWLVRAETMIQREDPAGAAVAYKEAVSIDPWNARGLMGYANLLLEHPETSSESEPQTLLESAVALNPHYIPAASAAIGYHVNRGQFSRARAIAEELIDFCPLLTNRNVERLRGFLDRVRGSALYGTEPEFDARIDQCRELEPREGGAGRAETAVMRWLMR